MVKIARCKRITMQIDNTILEKLERLSHLYIAEDRKEEVISQLSEIVSFVDNLAELDTSGLEASFSTLDGGTPLRDDKPISDASISSDILKNAPLSRDDFFIVPAIIE
jgi:aspartyl-tRNA(Asn)/glutamyl-tRNA(Gln) amidotransferase subunit C